MVTRVKLPGGLSTACDCAAPGCASPSTQSLHAELDRPTACHSVSAIQPATGLPRLGAMGWHTATFAQEQQGPTCPSFAAAHVQDKARLTAFNRWLTAFNRPWLGAAAHLCYMCRRTWQWGRAAPGAAGWLRRQGCGAPARPRTPPAAQTAFMSMIFHMLTCQTAAAAAGAALLPWPCQPAAGVRAVSQSASRAGR